MKPGQHLQQDKVCGGEGFAEQGFIMRRNVTTILDLFTWHQL